MAARYKFRNNNSLGRLAVATFALATLSYSINAEALGRSFLARTSWFAADILRLLILRADWRTLLPYLCHGTRLVQHFLQFVACP